MNEAFLQYLWQYRLFDGPLHTTDGLPVEILAPGSANTDAGPDFSDARVRIGDTLWAGNVEVHIKSSDWIAHHHSDNKAYLNVVLHVVYQFDTPILRPDGQPVPTLEARRSIPESVWNNYEALLNPPQPMEVPCLESWAAIDPMRVHAALDALLLERLQRKTSEVRRLLASSHGNWEQCCYWLLAHYFGGKTNGFAFELLAKATDLRFLARWRDNLERTEAILFGQAGLLDGYFEDDYPRALQAAYEPLRKGAGLNPISAHLWKYFRLRPSSFPTLRISQFAHLISNTHSLFSQLLETSDAEKLRAYFILEASDYWHDHYRFDQPSKPSRKSTGSMFANMLVINAWVPLLFQYGVEHGDEHYKDQALDILHQLPPEDNRIVRLFANAGVCVHDAAQSQALIQLFNEYCKPHRCLQCRLGYSVINAAEQKPLK